MNSWRRSSAACPRPLTWRAPPRCAPPSAASSPAIPSSADSAPSTHRYILLPALPDHLADQVHQPDIIQCEPFLAPPADDEDSSFRDFRVMCLVRFRTKLVLFVFSSCAGQWLADPVTFDMFGCLASDRYYAHGCFCWEVLWEDMLLVFDARMMEFSTVDPPPPPSPCVLQRAIVEAGQGKLGMLTISEYTDEAGAYQYQLFFYVQHKDENGTNQWQSKSVIPLPVNYCYVILGVAGGYLLLIGFPQQNRLLLDYFSLNLQTFQIEWFCQTGRCAITGGLYADLPPSLSPPTI